MFAAAEELAAAGLTLLQYRNKQGTARQMLDQARELRARLAPSVKLIMNDRADLCLAAAFDGLHVGQDDLSPESARKIIGPARWLGVSTHNPEQLCRSRLKLPPTTLPSAPSSRPPARPIPIRSWDSKASAGQGN